MTDDKGVLGNLPRSRPGQRSEKRAAKVAAPAEAKPRRAAGRRRAAPSGKRQAAPSGQRQAAPSGGDPVRDTVRGVAGLAMAGAKVANGVAREVLRRLPRP